MLGFHPLASAPLGDDGGVVVPAQQGAASLVGSSSLAASAKTIASGSVALSGVGSASFAAELLIPANASLSSSGAVAVEGRVLKLAATSLSAEGSASISGNLAATGSSSVSATGSVVAFGGVKTSGATALSANGSASVTGLIIKPGAMSVSGSGSVVFLEEFRHGGRFEPIVGELPRWTEQGDTRVTEDGQPRVADNVTQNIGESSILIDSSVTLFTSEVYAKYLDAWELAEISVKNNGEWVEPVSAYQNINGSWKRIA